eukprot:575070-Prorocentrum_minimum.AAC.2
MKSSWHQVNGAVPVQPGSLGGAKEELGAVGVGPSVRLQAVVSVPPCSQPTDRLTHAADPKVLDRLAEDFCGDSLPLVKSPPWHMKLGMTLREIVNDTQQPIDESDGLQRSEKRAGSKLLRLRPIRRPHR